MISNGRERFHLLDEVINRLLRFVVNFDFALLLPGPVTSTTSGVRERRLSPLVVVYSDILELFVLSVPSVNDRPREFQPLALFLLPSALPRSGCPITGTEGVRFVAWLTVIVP